MPQTQSEYISRINKVLDYIEANSGRSMTLEELATVASFSRFHFSRIFYSVVGETPIQFIMRIRLEKAASLLLSCKEEPVFVIAMRCGFADKSVFSRYFKGYFGISPSKFRTHDLNNSNISQHKSINHQPEDTPALYFCPESKTMKWRTSMKLNKSMEIRELPKMTLAYVRNIGPYNGDQQMFGKLRDKLFAWAASRNLIMGNDVKFLVLYHDDPTVALGENLRMSLCLTVPPDTRVEGEVGKMEIDATKYAIARFELTGPEFQKAWNWVYGQWLPVSGYQPDDKPYFEMYTNAPKDGNYVIDFCVPVKRL